MKLLDYELEGRDEDMPPADDPFFYGWRDILEDEDGNPIWEQIPLTLANVLHPQVDHRIPQGYKDSLVRGYLFNALDVQLLQEQDTALVCRMLLDWEDEHIEPVSPDFAIVRGVTTTFDEETFYLKQSGGHLDLIIEVTGHNTWKVVLDGYREPNKVQVYEQAGVPLYIIVDCYNHEEGETMQIIVYRLNEAQRYERVEPDTRGWYWIACVQLWIGPYKDTIALYEPDGTRMKTHLELCLDRKRFEEETRAYEEQTRAHIEARLRAEEQIRAYEEQTRAHIEARQRAEEQTRAYVEARQRAEERIRELEAQLRDRGIELPDTKSG